MIFPKSLPSPGQLYCWLPHTWPVADGVSTYFGCGTCKDFREELAEFFQWFSSFQIQILYQLQPLACLFWLSCPTQNHLEAFLGTPVSLRSLAKEVKV